VRSFRVGPRLLHAGRVRTLGCSGDAPRGNAERQVSADRAAGRVCLLAVLR